MALIKHAKSDRLLKQAVVLDMGDLARQAERIVSSARDEAGRILADARLKAQQLVDQGDQRGYDEGLRRGLQEGRETGEREGRESALSQTSQHIEQIAANWSAALERWESERKIMLHEAREDVIRFAIAVAEKVVRRVAQGDPSIIADQLGEALAMISRPTSLEVLINPDDRPVVEQVLPELLARIARCERATLRDEPSIARGGCVVTTAGGRVDATIETQLARIAEALAPDRRSTQPDGGPHAAADVQSGEADAQSGKANTT